MTVSRISQSTLQSGFQKFNSVWDGRSAIGSMDAITSVVLPASSATVTFNNIPQTYSSLQIRIYAQLATNAFGIMNFNSIETGYQSLRQLYGSAGSVVTNKPNASTAYLETGFFPSSSTTFGVTIIDILDYANTSKHKTVRNFGGWDDNSLGYTLIRSGLWANTAAINSIRLGTNGTVYNANSVFALYGVK